MAQAMFSAVAKPMHCRRLIQRSQHGLMRNATKRQQNRAGTGSSQFRSQKAVAGTNFNAGRFVRGRQAFNRVGDAAIYKHKTIVTRGGLGSVGKAVRV